MNIDLKAQAQSLLNTSVGKEPGGSPNANTATTALPIFSQLLSSQVKVFQELDAKNTVNTAQLLSPNIVQASKLQMKDNPHQDEVRAGENRQADAFMNITKTGEINAFQAAATQNNNSKQVHTELAFAKLAEPAVLIILYEFSNFHFSISSQSAISISFIFLESDTFFTFFKIVRTLFKSSIVLLSFSSISINCSLCSFERFSRKMLFSLSQTGC